MKVKHKLAYMKCCQAFAECSDDERLQVGSVIVKNNRIISCGTGFDDKLRKEIWDNKEAYLGKLASIRYMSVGAKDKPRIPSFIWFRHTEDIS